MSSNEVSISRQDLSALVLEMENQASDCQKNLEKLGIYVKNDIGQGIQGSIQDAIVEKYQEKENDFDALRKMLSDAHRFLDEELHLYDKTVSILDSVIK